MVVLRGLLGILITVVGVSLLLAGIIMVVALPYIGIFGAVILGYVAAG